MMFRVEVFNSKGAMRGQQRANSDADAESKALIASSRARGWRADCYFGSTLTATFISGERQSLATSAPARKSVDSPQQEGSTMAAKKKATKRTGTKSTKRSTAPKVARKKAPAKAKK